MVRIAVFPCRIHRFTDARTHWMNCVIERPAGPLVVVC
jgi:hypothetical protein